MGGVSGISNEQHIAVAPRSSAYGHEPNPAAVVGDQVASLEHVREYLRAEGDALLVAFAGLPRALRGIHLAALDPARFFELDDEGAHDVAVRVCMGLDDAEVGLRDEELERVEDQGRTQPDVPRVPCIELGPENLCTRLASDAVHTVGTHNQVVLLA